MGNSSRRAAGLATRRAARAAGAAAQHAQVPPSAPGAGVSGRGVSVQRSEGASEAVSHVFGRALSNQELAQAFGAPRGSTLLANAPGRSRRMLSVRVYGPGYDASKPAAPGRQHDPHGAAWQGWYNVYRADALGTLGRHGAQDVLVHIQYFRAEQPGQGVGTRVFADQVRAAPRFGIKEFTLQAGRNDTTNPAERMIGYKTWGALGFNGILKPEMRQAATEAGLGRVRTLRQVLHTPEGRAWWNEHGNLIGLRFQVRPGNQSWRQLDTYLRGKGFGEL